MATEQEVQRIMNMASDIGGKKFQNVGFVVMIEDKSKSNQPPTMKYAKDEQEARSMVAVAKSMGLTAIYKPKE